VTTPAAIAPVPVHVVSGDAIDQNAIFQGVAKAFSPDLRVATTFQLLATGNPVRIVSRDDRRFKVTIFVVLGSIVVGEESQVGAVLQGGAQLPAGSKLELYSGEELYALGYGGACTVSVVTETFSRA
jgi:hypothetical protein